MVERLALTILCTAAGIQVHQGTGDLSLSARGAVRTAIQSSVTHQRHVEKKQGHSMKRALSRDWRCLLLETGSKPLGWSASLGCIWDAGALTHLPIHYHVGLQSRASIE